MQRLILPGALLLAVSVSGCDLVGVRGSGDVIGESRNVSDFTEVVLEGSGRVEIAVTGEESLTIQAEDNLMPLLTSEVDDGVLELGATEVISPTEQIVYTITVASLEAVTVQGSGTLTALGVEAASFAVTASGSGEVFLSDLSGDELVVRVSGSGDAEVSGSTRHLQLDISGSGSYRGENLISATADIDVSGSGDAVINVTENLKAVISGSGNATYLGDPASVDTSLSGSGEIEEG